MEAEDHFYDIDDLKRSVTFTIENNNQFHLHLFSLYYFHYMYKKESFFFCFIMFSLLYY